MNRSNSAELERWALLVLLGALTAYGPMALNLYLPSLPAIATELSLAPAQAQGTVSAFLIGMALGQIFCGPASDRFGRRVCIMVGGAIYVAANVACALADSAETLLAARFVAGLGGCAGSVVARAVLRDRFDHIETARSLSTMMSIVGLAPILAPLLGGFVLLAGGWRLNFWLLTLFGTLVSAAAFLWLRESRSAETLAQARSESVLEAYWAILRCRRLMGYALALALNTSAFFIYIAASPSLLIDSYGLSPSQFGWIFAVNALGIVAGGQVNRHLLSHYLPDRIMLVSIWVGAGFAALLVVAALTEFGGKWSVLILLFLLLSTFAFTAHNCTAGALNVDRLRAGSISAFLGFLQFALGATTGYLSSLFFNGTARPVAFAIFVVMTAGVIVARIFQLGRAPADTQPQSAMRPLSTSAKTLPEQQSQH